MQTEALTPDMNEIYPFPESRNKSNRPLPLSGTDFDDHFHMLTAQMHQGFESLGVAGAAAIASTRGENLSSVYNRVSNFREQIKIYLKLVSLEVYLPLRRELANSPDSEQLRKLEYQTRLLCRRISILSDHILEAPELDGPLFQSKIKSIQATLEHHKQFESKYLMPLYRSAFTPETERVAA